MGGRLDGAVRLLERVFAELRGSIETGGLAFFHGAGPCLHTVGMLPINDLQLFPTSLSLRELLHRRLKPWRCVIVDILHVRDQLSMVSDATTSQTFRSRLTLDHSSIHRFGRRRSLLYTHHRTLMSPHILVELLQNSQLLHFRRKKQIYFEKNEIK